MQWKGLLVKPGSCIHEVLSKHMLAIMYAFNRIQICANAIHLSEAYHSTYRFGLVVFMGFASVTLSNG